MFHSNTLVSQCSSLITVSVCRVRAIQVKYTTSQSLANYFTFLPRHVLRVLRVPEVSTGPARRQMSMVMVVTVILNTKQPSMTQLISLTFHIDILATKHAVLKKKRMKRKECAR